MKKDGVKDENAGNDIPVLMEDPEIAISIITCEGHRSGSLCDFCLQHNTTCCPGTKEGIHECCGYHYNKSPSREVVAYIKR